MSEPWKWALLADLDGSEESVTKKHGALFLLARGVFPWLLTVVLGVCVAFTGVYIAYNCDFLADLRFGYCQNLFFADRKRCCGGVENFDDSLQSCIRAKVSMVQDAIEVNWIPWEHVFGLSSHTHSVAGYIVSFTVYFLSCVVMTGIACFLVQTFSPQARGSGIPEVKASIGGFDLPKPFKPRCLLIKSLGLSFAVGAGLSLGKEGPLIHVGVCWAHLLSAMSPFGKRKVAFRGAFGALLHGIPRNELVAVGAATGVSTAFGAPLGGVLFAVEELGTVRQLSKRCLILCFLGAFSSSFCLKYMDLSGTNSIILFGLSQSSKLKYAKEWVASDMWTYLLLGVLGGLCGAAFVHLNCAVAKLRKQALREDRVWLLPKRVQEAFLKCCPSRIFGFLCDPDSQQLHPQTIALLEGLIVASITGIVNFPFSKLLKYLTVEATNALFETCPNDKGLLFGLCEDEADGGFKQGWLLTANLIVSALVRFFLTVITFGMSVPSGLFIPSLFIGSCLGRAVGTMRMMFSDISIESGSYALVGASAMLGGFSRLTVSLVVIMFELTGDLTQVVPVMCACLTAKVVGDYFNQSIYDEHAILSGFAVIEDLPDHVRFHAVCSDVMETIDLDFVFDASSQTHVVELSKRILERRVEEEEGGSLPSVMLLRKAPHQAIFGVVDTIVLRNWLVQNRRVGAFTFSNATEGPLLGINTPKNKRPSFVVRGKLQPSERKVLAPEVRELQFTSLETTLGIVTDFDAQHDDDLEGEVWDVSHFVDTHVARVHASAPISTAYFIYHQNPLLKYIICLSRFNRRVGVITRKKFMDAICSGILAYPPLNLLAEETDSPPVSTWARSSASRFGSDLD